MRNEITIIPLSFAISARGLQLAYGIKKKVKKKKSTVNIPNCLALPIWIGSNCL